MGFPVTAVIQLDLHAEESVAHADTSADGGGDDIGNAIPLCWIEHRVITGPARPKS